MEKVKFILLLPLTYNDRSRVPKGVQDQMLDELYALAGGYHIAGAGKGAYRMKDGQKQVDQSLQVWVAVEDEEIPALRAMVGRFAAILGQETMYLERTGGTVDFVPPSPVGGLFQ